MHVIATTPTLLTGDVSNEQASGEHHEGNIVRPLNRQKIVDKEHTQKDVIQVYVLFLFCSELTT